MIPSLPKKYAHLQSKVVSYHESRSRAYEVKGVVYSAYQRKEVVGCWLIKEPHIEWFVVVPLRPWDKEND